MLWVFRDEAGRLQAACSWWLVDVNGVYDSKGAYVYLDQLEISPGMNLQFLRRRMVIEIGCVVPWAVGVYWERRDRFTQRPHAFRREQLQQLREGVEV